MQKGPRPGWLKRTFESAKNDKHAVSVAELLSRVEKLILKHTLDNKDSEQVKIFSELYNSVQRAFDLTK